ncbi:MAG: glycosyltransferase family 4 protein, partial [Planctomycetes bacterium]|nr:glycosyltransferase family 4 protein [Planctomycetota bacterium]
LAWLRAPLWKRVERWGLARQKHIISITPYVRNLVEPLTDAHIYDIDNPIDPACFRIRRKEIPGRVFFAGWITPRKNPLGLIHAFAKVRNEGVDATLHLAGEESDPPYAESVRKAIDKYGLGDHVHMLGRVRTEDIRRELAAASVFVLPSRQENAPMAISESMAAGVPVIASNLCGMPFMVREGETGYLIDPDDHDMIAERIIRLLSDTGLRQQMGRQAAEDATRRFHPTSVASKTRAVYESVMAEFAGSACGSRDSSEHSSTTVKPLNPQPKIEVSTAR